MASPRAMIPGLSARLAPSSVPVVTVHYSADPAKRPGTPAGNAWLAEAESGYPGGRRSPRWRKELEIEYAAFGGTKVFPDWDLWSRGPIVCAPFDPKGYKLYGSYDHGWNNPAAFHVHGINGDGHKVTLWEFYADFVPLSWIAKIILGQDVTLPRDCPRSDARIQPGRRTFPGNPFGGRLTWIVADPSMWAEDQPMRDEPNKSIADLFSREHVHFLEGERGGDQTVINWLLSYEWRDVEQPRYRIVNTCPRLIWEIGQQRYRELTERQAQTKDASEMLIDKSNHGWDGLKMFLKRFPPGPGAVKAVQRPGTFNWFREQAKRASRGDEVQTYSRAMVS
jgi:hypothetical protein